MSVHGLSVILVSVLIVEMVVLAAALFWALLEIRRSTDAARPPRLLLFKTRSLTVKGVDCALHGPTVWCCNHCVIAGLRENGLELSSSEDAEVEKTTVRVGGPLKPGPSA